MSPTRTRMRHTPLPLELARFALHAFTVVAWLTLTVVLKLGSLLYVGSVRRLVASVRDKLIPIVGQWSRFHKTGRLD